MNFVQSTEGGIFSKEPPKIQSWPRTVTTPTKADGADGLEVRALQIHTVQNSLAVREENEARENDSGTQSYHAVPGNRACKTFSNSQNELPMKGNTLENNVHIHTHMSMIR